MCRYAFHTYKQHFACFGCRKMFRPAAREDLGIAFDKVRRVPCPECKQPMHDMGLNFKAPRQHNVPQWRKVQMLHAQGLTWHDCGCGGSGPAVKTLRDAREFLASQK